jgi:hypothetical protein
LLVGVHAHRISISIHHQVIHLSEIPAVMLL